MALSGTFIGSTVGGGYRLEIDWSATQSIANNQSTVTAKVYWCSLGSSYTVSSTADKTGGTTIDGTTVTWSATDASLNGNQRRLVATTSKTVTHNTDGSKSVAISAYFNVAVDLGGYVSSVSASGTAVLTPIPRETTYSGIPNWTVCSPTAFVMNFNKASTSYTTDVVIKVNGVTIKTILGITGPAYTVSWSNLEIQTMLVELNKDTSSWNQTSTIEMTTKSGTTTIGSMKSATGTFTAPTATSVSGANFTIGNSTTITMGSEVNAAFVYDLTATIGSYTKTLLTKGNYANPTTWTTSTDSTSLYGQLGSATSGTITYTLTTYWANGTTYTKVRNAMTSSNYTASVDTTTQKPTFTATGLTYYDSNTTVTTLTGATSGAAYLCVVQGQSTLVVSLPVGGLATASSGTSISKYTCTFYGITKTSSAASTTVAQTFTFAATDLATVNKTANAVVTATDARGVASSVNLSINVVPYLVPSITASALRDDGFSTPVTLKLSGSISALNVNGVNKNSVSTMTYQYRTTGGSYNPVSNFTAGTATFPAYAATDLNLATQLSNTNSYDVSFAVKDALGNTSTSVKTVGKGAPILFIDSTKSSVGVNKIPDNSNSFEVGGNVTVSGSLSATGGLIVNNKNYVTEMSASIPATANWYRIAQSPSGINNCLGTFEIQAAQSSHHTYTQLQAGIDFGDSDLNLNVLAHSCYGAGSSGAITYARIVRNPTYTGNYAYLEVYSPNATAYTMTVRLVGGSNWTLVSPDTVGSIPTGYLATTINLFVGGGVMTPLYDILASVDDIQGTFSVGKTGNTATNRAMDYSTVLNIPANNNSDFQFSSYYGNSNRLYFRSRHDTDGAWLGWNEVLTEEDTNSNANGIYWRFSNGMQICYLAQENVATNSFTWSSQTVGTSGWAYWYTSGYTWDYPATFLTGTVPATFLSADIPFVGNESHNTWHNASQNVRCNYEHGIITGSSPGTQAGATVLKRRFLAIGKWK
jgi:hypothetical protein